MSETRPFSGLAPPYGAVVVDPPWHYDEINPPNPGLTHGGPVKIGAKLSYSTMTLDEITALPVGELVEDGRCFLWTTNRYLRHAWSVLEAWRFKPQDRVLVWCKPPMGTLNVTTEFVLIGRKGNPPRMPWHGTTWFQWARPHHAHSVKPAPFLDLVESWCPGPYVELFARSPRLGWDAWGKGWESVGAGGGQRKDGTDG